MADMVMAAGIDATEILIFSSPISACRSALPKRLEMSCATVIERALASAQ